MAKTFSKLGTALDLDNWKWLQDERGDIADALEAEVTAGADPDELRRFILDHIGQERTALAARCMSAARHLASRVRT